MSEGNIDFHLSPYKKRKKKLQNAFNPKKSKKKLINFHKLSNMIEAYQKIIHKNNYVIGPSNFKVSNFEKQI